MAGIGIGRHPLERAVRCHAERILIIMRPGWIVVGILSHQRRTSSLSLFDKFDLTLGIAQRPAALAGGSTGFQTLARYGIGCSQHQGQYGHGYKYFYDGVTAAVGLDFFKA